MSTTSPSEVHTISLVGTPNSGKSTLFNRLTGLRQKVGNFPGVTVEPKRGTVVSQGRSLELIDVPGLYSLQPRSADEEFSVQVLRAESKKMARPDACVFVIDGTNLEKGLSLFAQYAKLQLPSLVVVTMIDALKAQGTVLDDILLQRKLGVNVLTVVGSKGTGVEELRESLAQSNVFRIPKNIENLDSIEAQVQWARDITSIVLNNQTHDVLTTKLDAWLLHPVAGYATFFAVMALFFVAIFSWAEPVMSLIERGVSAVQSEFAALIPNELLQDFVCRGVLAGVGSVVIFLPQIVLLMVFVTVLEDCGYLARAAFLVDRVMGLFGLQGRSFVPLLGSFACAIPGILSARIIPGEKDRMATILVAPLMTCSARLPVYTLLIGAFIPAQIIWGAFPLQSLVLAGLYLVGLLSGLLIALLMRRTVFRADKLHFLMEFPPYRLPSLKSVAITVWMKCQDFLKTAGTIILGISILLWVLSTFPHQVPQPGMTALQAQQYQLENSLAGQLGKTIQPMFAPLGFDWKITVGVIGSFAARETFVSVMGQMYALDVEQNSMSLRETLSHSMSFASALSVLAFYIFALQCMSTIAVIRRETGSWKWSAIAFSYTFVLAYGCSWLCYTIATLI